MARWSYVRITREEERERQNAMKLKLCLAIRRVAMREGWTQKQLGWYLRASRGRVGYVVKQELDKVTFNQLFRYLVRLAPKAEIMVSI